MYRRTGAILMILWLLGFSLHAQTPRGGSQPENWMETAPTSTGPEVGQKIPPFRGIDQNGRVQDFNSIKGPQGAVIMFNRSADW